VKVTEEPSRFHIKARFLEIGPGDLILTMTENYGKLQKLAQLIPDISIQMEGKPVPVIDTLSEFSWKVILKNRGALVIDYDINALYPYSSLNMVRLPYRDQDHLYFPAASVFVHPNEQFLVERGLTIDGIRIDFDLPPGWIAATSWGMGKSWYNIDPADLGHLNDGLVGLGPYRIYESALQQTHLSIAILNKGSVSADDGNSRSVADDEIIEAIRGAFGSGQRIFGFSPVDKYFSLIHFVLEHPSQVNGNALGWTTNLNCSQKFDRLQWIQMKSHIFSEIFHLWNGTQGPPLSRSQDDHSTIWFTEGVTDFYRLKNMYTSGMISEEEYFQMFGMEFGTVYNSSRREDNLDMISRDYYADRTAMKLTYSKGACLAFALDLLMQHTSSLQKNFDDVMRAALRRYDFRISRQCYTRAGLDSVFMDVLGNRYFSSYQRLFGREFIEEFRSILEMSGLRIEQAEGRRLYFGIINFGPPSMSPFLIDEIDRESPAFKAGLKEKDILLEINGHRLREDSDLKKYLEGLTNDQIVDLTVRRNETTLVICTPWLSYQSLFTFRRK